MKPSERLRLLGGRTFEVAVSTPPASPMPFPDPVGRGPARPFGPVHRIYPPDRPPSRRPEMFEALPNPFLAIDPEPATPMPASVQASPARDDVPADEPTLRPEIAELTAPAEPAIRLEAGGKAAPEDPGLVESVVQLPQVADECDRARRSREPPDAIPPMDGRADTAWSRPSKLRLTPDMTAAESLRLIVAQAQSHLFANHDCARLNLHVEGVHQCRIALRRLRSAFKTFGPVLRRERIQPIARDTGWIAQILGTARDLDVLQTELVVPAAEAFGRTEELGALATLLDSRRAAAHDAVGQALTGPRYRHLLDQLRELGCDQLASWREICACPDQPVTEVAVPALGAAHRKLLNKGTGFEALSDAERHEVRIAVKRLRYTLEFFAPLFDGGSKKEYIKRAARLQDDLGRLNDVATASRTLAQVLGLTGDDVRQAAHEETLGTLAFAAGGILGWHRREAAQANQRLVKDWYALVGSTPFWSR